MPLHIYKLYIMKLMSLLFLVLPMYLFTSSIDPVPEVPVSEKITWHDIEEIESIVKNDNRKVIIKMYAEWCKPCKMYCNTFEDAKVMKYINDNFHVVNFDVNTSETVRFKNKDYGSVKMTKRNYNELAIELLGDQMSFPSLVVLDETLNTIEVLKGYKKPSQLIESLQSI